MDWIKKNKRKSIAIIGALFIWGGIVQIVGFSTTLIYTGVLMVVAVLFSYFPD